jgi:hypothetical protein
MVNDTFLLKLTNPLFGKLAIWLLTLFETEVAIVP